MQPNPALLFPQTMGAVLIPFMGSASPVMPTVEACWDTALATDTLTKEASRVTVEPLCAALLCMESALGGIKEMSNVLNNKLPRSWDPRQEAWCGHPSKVLEPSILGWQTIQPLPLLLPSTPIILTPWFFCPLLCSGGSDSCYQGSLFTLRISQYTNNDPVVRACTTNQLLSSVPNRQGGESKLTMSFVRHMHFTLDICPKTCALLRPITVLTEIQETLFVGTLAENRSNAKQMRFKWKWLLCRGCVHCSKSRERWRSYYTYNTSQWTVSSLWRLIFLFLHS